MIYQLSGKKWIYKKFDNLIRKFLKRKFFLDEITAKLLSIRNIDNVILNLF